MIVAVAGYTIPKHYQLGNVVLLFIMPSDDC